VSSLQSTVNTINTYAIKSAGTSGQVWTSDGSGAGKWASITTTPVLSNLGASPALNVTGGNTYAVTNLVWNVDSALSTSITGTVAVTGTGRGKYKLNGSYQNPSNIIFDATATLTNSQLKTGRYALMPTYPWAWDDENGPILLSATISCTLTLSNGVVLSATTSYTSVE